MENRDYLEMCSGALRANLLRSILSMLGIAIGVAAVVLLTSIGEGTRQYILKEFTQFGTNILAVNPGKTETQGIPGIFGGTTRKLTIDDALAIARLPRVQRIVPMTMGLARVEAEGRGRSVMVYGTSSEFPKAFQFEVGQGVFIPKIDLHHAMPVVVLGPKVKREIFGDENALGKSVRISGYRLRVIGVMAPKGQMLGIDLDDAVYLPVTLAMRIFNLDELNEIDVSFAHGGLADPVAEDVRKVLLERHRGHEDFTITTQTAMLEVFDKVIRGITLAVSLIAGISLLVGAVGIFTMMWISVGERISEIGLLLAVGATPKQVHRLFLIEATLLTTLGGVAGSVFGLGFTWLLRSLLPALPVQVQFQYLAGALVMSIATGIASGVAPARRAAELTPVEALRTE